MCIEKNNICNCIFNLLASIVSAIAIATLFYAGLISSILVLVYITLVVGILGLIYFIFSIFCNKKKVCNCIDKSNLVPNSIASIILTIFALTVSSLASSSIATAILIGSIAYFLISNIFSFINLLICDLCSNRCCKE